MAGDGDDDVGGGGVRGLTMDSMWWLYGGGVFNECHSIGEFLFVSLEHPSLKSM